MALNTLVCLAHLASSPSALYSLIACLQSAFSFSVFTVDTHLTVYFCCDGDNGAVVAAYLKISALAGHITLAAGVVLSGLAIWGFLRSRALDKMALDTKIDSKVELAKPGKKIERLEEEAQKIDAQEKKATKKATKR